MDILWFTSVFMNMPRFYKCSSTILKHRVKPRYPEASQIDTNLVITNTSTVECSPNHSKLLPL